MTTSEGPASGSIAGPSASVQRRPEEALNPRGLREHRPSIPASDAAARRDLRARRSAALAVLTDYFQGDDEGDGPRLGPDEPAEWWTSPRQMAEDFVAYLEDAPEVRETLREWIAGKRKD